MVRENPFFLYIQISVKTITSIAQFGEVGQGDSDKKVNSVYNGNESTRKKENTEI